MSRILAIESSTLTASVALCIDGDVVLAKESGVNSHSQVLLGLIDECLQFAKLALSDLDTIAIGAGPGSFTGLRIGMATAKGLCFASGVSLTPVSSLAALALDCHSGGERADLLIPVLDARRKEIFVGFFREEDGHLRAQAPERVLAPDGLAALVASVPNQGVILCGDGACKYEELLSSIGPIARDVRTTPSAASVAMLAEHMPAAEHMGGAAPTYVRLPEAEIKFPDGNTGGTFSTQAIDATREGEKS